jgi:hypothetical protein
MTDEADADQREHLGGGRSLYDRRLSVPARPAGTELAQLLCDNRDRIAVSDIEIVAGNRYEPGQRGAFVALADVPDLVWRRTRPKTPLIISPISISLVEPRQAGRR